MTKKSIKNASKLFSCCGFGSYPSCLDELNELQYENKHAGKKPSIHTEACLQIVRGNGGKSQRKNTREGTEWRFHTELPSCQLHRDAPNNATFSAAKNNRNTCKSPKVQWERSRWLHDMGTRAHAGWGQAEVAGSTSAGKSQVWEAGGEPARTSQDALLQSHDNILVALCVLATHRCCVGSFLLGRGLRSDKNHSKYVPSIRAGTPRAIWESDSDSVSLRAPSLITFSGFQAHVPLQMLASFIGFYFIILFLEFTLHATELFLSAEMTDNEVLFGCTQVECGWKSWTCWQ